MIDQFPGRAGRRGESGGERSGAEQRGKAGGAKGHEGEGIVKTENREILNREISGFRQETISRFRISRCPISRFPSPQLARHSFPVGVTLAALPKPLHARSLLLASLLCALADASRLHAMGSPPLSTDDTGTAPAGRWEYNLGFSTERRPGSRLSEMPSFDVNYGLGDRTHLNYELPWLRLGEDGSPSQSGFGNSAFGVKWRFFDNGEKGLSVSVFPKVEFNNPGSSSDERGLVGHGTQFRLPLQFQRTVGLLTLVGQIGREFGAGGDGWSFGLSAGHHVTEKVEVGVELTGGAAVGFHRSQLATNLGLTVDVSESCTLMLSLGRELHNHDGPRASLLAFVGLQWRR